MHVSDRVLDFANLDLILFKDNVFLEIWSKDTWTNQKARNSITEYESSIITNNYCLFQALF